LGADYYSKNNFSSLSDELSNNKGFPALNLFDYFILSIKKHIDISCCNKIIFIFLQK